jgi:hypothetical protein
MDEHAKVPSHRKKSTGRWSTYCGDAAKETASSPSFMLELSRSMFSVQTMISVAISEGSSDDEGLSRGTCLLMPD